MYNSSDESNNKLKVEVLKFREYMWVFLDLNVASST
jgi:hypothetical protein